MNAAATGDILGTFDVKKELNRIDDLVKEMDNYKATIQEGQAGLTDLGNRLGIA